MKLLRRWWRMAKAFLLPKSEHPDIANSGSNSLGTYLFNTRNTAGLAHMHRGYAWFLPLCLFRFPKEWAPRLLQFHGRFLHPQQQPSMYFPHLTASPFHKHDNIAATLEQNFEMIRDEYLHLIGREHPHPQGNLVQQGTWDTFMLFRDGSLTTFSDNRAQCPRTTSLLNSLPLCHHGGGNVYFSKMKPGTHIHAHHGYTNTRIRYHLGIEVGADTYIRVGQETRSWEAGKCLVFDDSFEHEVFHHGSVDRVVLIVDCWHPELTLQEREFVKNLLWFTNMPAPLE